MLLKINESYDRAMRSETILKAAALGAAVLLQNMKDIPEQTNENLAEMGFGLEYALADAEKARLDYQSALEQGYIDKIAELSNQLKGRNP